jgi:hypothetical protein
MVWFHQILSFSSHGCESGRVADLKSKYEKKRGKRGATEALILRYRSANLALYGLRNRVKAYQYDPESPPFNLER